MKVSVIKLQWLLALMRAQYRMYQNIHWTTRGNNYYGNHLLFQRLYESLPEQIDVLAEKMVAQFGIQTVNAHFLLMDYSYFWIQEWTNESDEVFRALRSERDFQKLIKDCYDSLKEDDLLSLGMDDFLMATASEHETNTYLLKQIKTVGDGNA